MTLTRVSELADSQVTFTSKFLTTTCYFIFPIIHTKSLMIYQKTYDCAGSSHSSHQEVIIHITWQMVQIIFYGASAHF